MTLAPYDKFKPGNVVNICGDVNKLPLFISMCILRDLPQFFVCSHVPMEFLFFFLQNRKEARKQKKRVKKRVVYARGGSRTRVFSS
jgi:hypothetical protein